MKIMGGFNFLLILFLVDCDVCRQDWARNKRCKEVKNFRAGLVFGVPQSCRNAGVFKMHVGRSSSGGSRYWRGLAMMYMQNITSRQSSLRQFCFH